MEIWKDINGYEGYYQVSNLGRVKRLEHTDNRGHTYKERVVKNVVTALGYKRVHLSKNNYAKWVFVHRLVAEAFVPRKNGCDIVNHLDNDPANNVSDNLEWTDYVGNMQHATKQGRMHYQPGNLLKAQQSREIPVIAVKDGVRLWYKSAAEASRVLGIAAGHIAAACRKEYGYKTSGGYEWEYADSELQSKQVPKKVGMSKDQQAENLRQKMRGNKIMLGRNLADETKQKLSEVLGRPVLQFTLDGTFVAEYCSANAAKKATGVSHIYSCANGERKSAGKFIWKWKDDSHEKSD